MEAFFKSGYFTALLIVFDVVAVIAVICITYRWLFKRIFDFLVSIVCIAVLSPLYIAVAICANKAKKRGEIDSLFQTEAYVGKKEKRVVLHTFATQNAQGERGAYGEWLKNTGIDKTARMFDLFLGRVSLIGITPISHGNHVFLEEENKGRYIAKIGLIHPLVLGGNREIDYDTLLHSENKYAWTFSFFGDCRIFFAWLLKKIRGESKEYMGKTTEQTYAEWLRENGKITDADLAAAKEAEL